MRGIGLPVRTSISTECRVGLLGTAVSLLALLFWWVTRRTTPTATPGSYPRGNVPMRRLA
jgi:hypothetical protein